MEAQGTGYQTAPPYTALAQFYDDLMSHVDYARWTRFALDLLLSNGLQYADSKNPPYLLECACGTGNAAMLFAAYGYRIDAFDRSGDMIAIARSKSRGMRNIPRYSVDEFLSFKTERCYDAALCFYDSINYILERDDLIRFVSRIKQSIKSGGLFLFDVSTEYNSQHLFSGRSDIGSGNGYRYKRIMNYDTSNRIQENRFEINFSGKDDTIIEIHRQRIYPLKTIRRIVQDAGLQILQEASDFTAKPPDSRSLRVHFVCQRPIV